MALGARKLIGIGVAGILMAGLALGARGTAEGQAKPSSYHTIRGIFDRLIPPACIVGMDFVASRFDVCAGNARILVDIPR